METEAYIIRFIKQPSLLCAKHAYTKQHHVDNKMQCSKYINMSMNMMVVLKKKTKHRLTTTG
jgi:hypothetical protein